MPQPTKPGVDWQDIERRYKAGEKAREIAHDHDVSRQAIEKRAKREGWRVGQPTSVALATAATLVSGPLAQDRFGLRTPENAALVLEMAEDGLPVTAIAAGIGMTPSAFKHWRDAEPALDAAIMEALARHARRHVKNVNDASDRGDARAAQWLLERNIVTKGDFGGKEASGGPTLNVVINVPRNAEQLVQFLEAETVE